MNRREAGMRLAAALAQYRGADTVVYALPRGGVPVAVPVADSLRAPLDLVITRKVGHPDNPEYAVCAITEEGDMLCDAAAIAPLDRQWLLDEAERQLREAWRRRTAYLGTMHPPSASGKRAVIIDDGMATGLTMRAAIRSLRAQLPKELIVAVPVAPHDVAEPLRHEADAVVVLEEPEHFRGGVASYYLDFPPVSDREVVQLLGRVRQRQAPTPSAAER